MNLHWLVSGQDGGRLILVFNGFAMDENPWRIWPQPKASSLAFVGGYQNLFEPLEVSDLARLRSFSRVDVIAWSLGVWVYSTVASAWALPPGKRVAVNGTLNPLNAQWGIPPAIFALTRKTFSVETRETFYRRVCGSEEVWAHFQRHAPLRLAEDQAGELAVLHEVLQNTASFVPPEQARQFFSSVIIGAKDLIMPPAAQRRYWHGGREVDAGHFLFHLWPSWEAFLASPEDTVHAV
ncbi:MAG: DUF452 family protein [Spirochaetales bacterium]|nr:DUF452 family protein [Spirochaetales bacterium]